MSESLVSLFFISNFSLRLLVSSPLPPLPPLSPLVRWSLKTALWASPPPLSQTYFTEGEKEEEGEDFSSSPDFRSHPPPPQIYTISFLHSSSNFRGKRLAGRTYLTCWKWAFLGHWISPLFFRKKELGAKNIASHPNSIEKQTTFSLSLSRFTSGEIRPGKVFAYCSIAHSSLHYYRLLLSYAGERDVLFHPVWHQQKNPLHFLFPMVY